MSFTDASCLKYSRNYIGSLPARPALQIERPYSAGTSFRGRGDGAQPAPSREPAAPFNHYIPVSRERADVLWGIWRPDRLLLLAMYNPASFYITL